MAFSGIIIKLITTFLPLIKEYITSSDKRKDILSLRTMTTWVIVTLILGTGCSLYLSEQARNNLNLHEPMIKQYNKVYQENVKLKAEHLAVQSSLADCQSRIANTLNNCEIKDSHVVAQASPEFVYDEKTHSMVLAENVKK